MSGKSVDAIATSGAIDEGDVQFSNGLPETGLPFIGTHLTLSTPLGRIPVSLDRHTEGSTAVVVVQFDAEPVIGTLLRILERRTISAPAAPESVCRPDSTY